MSDSAPSPRILQLVPKQSCSANSARKSATPLSSKPNTDVTMPTEAKAVPPGTPGAPTANTPSSMMNSRNTLGVGRWA